MGRVRYSPEKQKAIMSTFIDVTSSIIREEGMKAVSIRNVASKAGYSSATMYLYFNDIHELISLSSITYLRDYISEISKNMGSYDDPKEMYLYTWREFCLHAFKHPAVFNALFFGEHSESIDDTVKKYYSIFPHELDKISSNALSMLMAGNLYTRNMNILKHYTGPAGISDKDADMINEMTVCYFRACLDHALAEKLDDADITELTEHMVEGAEFLLN